MDSQPNIEKSVSQTSVGIQIEPNQIKPMKIKKRKYIVDGEQSKIWMEQILKPSVELEISSMVKWKEQWGRIAQWTEIIGKASQGISTVLAYSAGFFKEQNLILSFAAGATGTFAMVLIQYSVFAKRKRKIMESQVYELMADWNEPQKQRSDSISTEI